MEGLTCHVAGLHSKMLCGILHAMNPVVHTCANGLTLIINQESAHPIVSLQVWVGCGSMHENEHLGCGLSHLLEHMVFKGAGKYTAAQLNEEVSLLGGQWNAYTSTDRTVYHIEGPSAHWEHFLGLLLQLVFHPTFPPEEFEREREVIRREMEMYHDDPQEAAYRAIMETLFTAHPRREPVIGHRYRFDSVTYDEMVQYHSQHYVPNNIFLSIAGDVEPAHIISAVTAATADIPPAPSPPRPTLNEPRQWGTRTVRREFSQPTSTLILAWRIPHASHPDAAALSLLASILGEGRAAWLYTHFHDELSMAHDISTMLLPSRCGEGEGAFIIEADVDRELRDALRDTILEYIKALHQSDFSEGCQRVCRQIKAKHLQKLSTVQGIASTLGISWHLSRNPHSMQEWTQALHRVSEEDLARVAATYFATDRLTEISIDPLDSNPPNQANAHSGQLPPAECYTLPNGLTVVTRRDTRTPQIYATIAMKAGCPSVTEATAGINTLLSECLLKGTKSRSALDIANTLENLGGTLYTEAGNNTLCLHARALAEDANTMLELMADVILHAEIPQTSINTERDAIIADIQEQQEDPAALAFRKLRELCFGAATYGTHPDGTVETQRSFTREQLLCQYARIACGKNAVIAIVGDFDPDKLRRMVEQHFAALPEGRALIGAPTPTQKAGDERFFCDKEQAVLALAIPGCHVGSAELPKQLLFDEWCRDMSGPIFTEIREKRGLAYYASSASLLGVDTGCLFFYVGTAPHKIKETREALEHTLSHIATHGISVESLERAKATILSARLFARQSGNKLCSAMATDTLLGLEPDYTDKLPALLAAITPEDMQHYLATCLAPERPRTWCCVTPH